MTSRRAGKKRSKSWERYNHKRNFAELVQASKFSSDGRKVFIKESNTTSSEENKIIEVGEKKVYFEAREKARMERLKMKEKLEKYMGWNIGWEEYKDLMKNEVLNKIETGVEKLKEEVKITNKEKKKIEEERMRVEANKRQKERTRVETQKKKEEMKKAVKTLKKKEEMKKVIETMKKKEEIKKVLEIQTRKEEMKNVNNEDEKKIEKKEESNKKNEEKKQESSQKIEESMEVVQEERLDKFFQEMIWDIELVTDFMKPEIKNYKVIKLDLEETITEDILDLNTDYMDIEE